MKIDKIDKDGTTLTRKRFWDSALDAVIASRKTQGHNVKVSEHEGYGTIVDVTRESASAACPSSAIITLSEVVLDCGCVQVGASQWAIGIDTGGINDNPQSLDLVTCSIPTDGVNCAWFNHIADGVFFDETLYTLSDCSDSGTHVGDRFCDMYICKVGTLYQVLVTAINSIVFYGSSTDISSPIINASTSCDSVFHDYAFSDTNIGKLLSCNGFTDPTSFSRLGHGGTATITLP